MQMADNKLIMPFSTGFARLTVYNVVENFVQSLFISAICEVSSLLHKNLSEAEFQFPEIRFIEQNNEEEIPADHLTHSLNDSYIILLSSFSSYLM